MTQTYDLSKGVNPISDFLGYLYGSAVKAEAKEYFQSLQDSNGAQPFLLSNDDVIFVFTKGEVPGVPLVSGGGTLPVGNGELRSPALNTSAACRKDETNQE